jgi:hypothetical protein
MCSQFLLKDSHAVRFFQSQLLKLIKLFLVDLELNKERVILNFEALFLA